jgi:branched-chain amino acid:cation transporter, LIVCS family
MKFIKSQSLSIGLAMFSMFFGAGNIVFPLAIGQHAGNKNFLAALGLVLSAALMPIAGVVSMVLFNGSYRDFFGRLGKIPGFMLALAIISLLGPLGSTPRCIALSYAALKNTFFENLSPLFFSGIACSLIFLCSIKKRGLLDLLGLVLTPFLLFSLLLVIGLGFFGSSGRLEIEQSNFSLFIYGLREGYSTMDLLAAFFFSSTIFNILKMRRKISSALDDRKDIKTLFLACLVGVSLLAGIYIGFSYLASFHSSTLENIRKEDLLGALILKMAGPYAGFLVCTMVALACLTTAIALISSFADFFHTEVLQKKISYAATLFFAVCLTFFFSTWDFAEISAFLGPILHTCYPGLIALTFLNIAFKIRNFKSVKIPVFCIFGFCMFLEWCKI